MAKQLTDILEAAAQVRDEQTPEANTAERVGGVLTDLARFVGQSLMASDMKAQATTAAVQLKLYFHDDNGNEYTRTLNLPSVNPAAGTAGVLTTAQYDAMKQFGAARDLGTYTTKQSAWDRCARADAAGDTSAFILVFAVGTLKYYIFQSVDNDKAMQYLYEGQYRFTRYIQFADAQRKTVTYVQPWQKEGVRNLSYETATRYLVMKNMWGEQIGDSVQLPLATPSLNGLMDKEDKAKMNKYPSMPSQISTANAMTNGLMSANDKVKLDKYPASPTGIATATPTMQGLMSATDKAKLDALEERVAALEAAASAAAEG